MAWFLVVTGWTKSRIFEHSSRLLMRKKNCRRKIKSNQKKGNTNGRWKKNDEVSAVQLIELASVAAQRTYQHFCAVFIVDYMQSRGIKWCKNQGNKQKIQGNKWRQTKWEKNTHQNRQTILYILRNRNVIDKIVVMSMVWTTSTASSKSDMTIKFIRLFENNNGCLLRFIVSTS